VFTGQPAIDAAEKNKALLQGTQQGVADRMDVGTVSNATANGVTWDLPITFTAPQFLTVDGGTDYANHGEYVEAMGGGKIAAQKCVGMPIKSKAPKA